MKILNIYIIVFVFLLTASELSAQVVPGGSPRSRGFGGFSEAFGEDPLGTFDNPSVLGRKKDIQQQIAFAIGFAPVPVLDDAKWDIALDNFEDIWFRAAYIPNLTADDLHFSFWTGISSIVWSYRGNIRTKDGVANMTSSVGFFEAGASAGISVTDELNVGLGLGICFAFVRASGEDVFTSEKRNIDNLDVLFVPRIHLGLEWFILRNLGMTFTAALGPFDLKSGSVEDENFNDLSAGQISGVPPIQFGLSFAYELAAELHLYFECQFLFPQPPDYAAEPVPTSILSVAIGGEYLVMISGTEYQMAFRLGISGYNLFEGVWKSDAPVYEQFLSMLNLGLGFFIRGVSINISYAIVFWDDDVDFQNSRFSASCAFPF